MIYKPKIKTELALTAANHGRNVHMDWKLWHRTFESNKFESWMMITCRTVLTSFPEKVNTLSKAGMVTNNNPVLQAEA